MDYKQLTLPPGSLSHQDLVSVEVGKQYIGGSDSTEFADFQIYTASQTDFTQQNFMFRYFGITKRGTDPADWTEFIVESFPLYDSGGAQSLFGMKYGYELDLKTSFCFRSDGSFTTLCWEGYFKNGNDCTECVVGCAECGQWNGFCYRCEVGYQFVSASNSCVQIETSCPTTKYYDSTLLSCQPCSPPCRICDEDPDVCLWCVAGYNYVDDGSKTCILDTDPCPAGTFKDPKLALCTQCKYPCVTCGTSATDCIECYSDFDLFYEFKGQCFYQCPQGTFTSGSHCEVCHTNCLECSMDPDTCTYCKDGFFLDSTTSTCDATCNSGFYPDADSRACMECYEGCAECNTNNYTCTECNPGWYLHGTTCGKSCPKMYYWENSVTNTCDDCNPLCEICISDEEDCTTCRQGKFFSLRMCYDACPLKTYSGGIKCFDCHPNCIDCFGG